MLCSVTEVERLYLYWCMMTLCTILYFENLTRLTNALFDTLMLVIVLYEGLRRRLYVERLRTFAKLVKVETRHCGRAHGTRQIGSTFLHASFFVTATR